MRSGAHARKLETHAVSSTDALLAEMSNWSNLGKDPAFVAELTKAHVVEDLLALMESQGINRNQLAQRLGKSRQYVGRVLGEQANFTIERLAEFAAALDANLEVRITSPNQNGITPLPRSGGVRRAR
jgi:antitoxin component HigA of HigAB toxin-antitoxin module